MDCAERMQAAKSKEISTVHTLPERSCSQQMCITPQNPANEAMNDCLDPSVVVAD